MRAARHDRSADSGSRWQRPSRWSRPRCPPAAARRPPTSTCRSIGPRRPASIVVTLRAAAAPRRRSTRCTAGRSSSRAPDGAPVHDARFAVDGGMPQHGHGLPTQPRVTRELADGTYLLEGMKFSMTGWWEVKLAIQGPHGADKVTFNTRGRRPGRVRAVNVAASRHAQAAAPPRPSPPRPSLPRVAAAAHPGRARSGRCATAGRPTSSPPSRRCSWQAAGERPADRVQRLRSAAPTPRRWAAPVQRHALQPQRPGLVRQLPRRRPPVPGRPPRRPGRGDRHAPHDAGRWAPAHSPFLFWDGRKDSLWSQALGPLEDAAEHGGNRVRFVRLVAGATTATDYEAVFGALPALGRLPRGRVAARQRRRAAAWSAMPARAATP